MTTRADRRKAYFHRQKDFYRNFTGTVQIDDILVRLGGGKVVDAERTKHNKPDIACIDGSFWLRKDVWAKNPTLLKEFIGRCIRTAKGMIDE